MTFHRIFGNTLTMSCCPPGHCGTSAHILYFHCWVVFDLSVVLWAAVVVHEKVRLRKLCQQGFQADVATQWVVSCPTSPPTGPIPMPTSSAATTTTTQRKDKGHPCICVWVWLALDDASQNRTLFCFAVRVGKQPVSFDIAWTIVVPSFVCLHIHDREWGKLSPLTDTQQALDRLALVRPLLLRASMSCNVSACCLGHNNDCTTQATRPR